MTERTQAEDDLWPRGWEGHERLQRQWMAQLPFRLKLQWLEAAQRLVEHLRKQRAAPKGPDAT
jgi:hypothetical protein